MMLLIKELRKLLTMTSFGCHILSRILPAMDLSIKNTLLHIAKCRTMYLSHTASKTTEEDSNTVPPEPFQRNLVIGQKWSGLLVLAGEIDHF